MSISLILNSELILEKRLREQQRQEFLIRHGWDPTYCHFLAGDASPRQYYRWQNGEKSIILMDTPLTEHPKQFCQMADLLRDNNLSAPDILVADFQQGFIALEDFGDQTYNRALTVENTGSLYTLAVEALIHLHRNQLEQPVFIPPYTTAELLREAMLFLEWYYPFIKGNPPPQTARQLYQSILQEAFTNALQQQPHRLILRDYHVDNLILLENRKGVKRCGLLDFQCALWGPIGYDLVSLFEDARRDVDLELKEQLWQVYGNAFPEIDLMELRQSSAVLSVGRHLKILGVFTRLAQRDGKENYLVHMPRLRRLLEISLSEAKIPALNAWFQEYFSPYHVEKIEDCGHGI